MPEIPLLQSDIVCIGPSRAPSADSAIEDWLLDWLESGRAEIRGDELCLIPNPDEPRTALRAGATYCSRSLADPSSQWCWRTAPAKITAETAGDVLCEALGDVPAMAEWRADDGRRYWTGVVRRGARVLRAYVLEDGTLLRRERMAPAALGRVHVRVSVATGSIEWPVGARAAFSAEADLLCRQWEEAILGEGHALDLRWAFAEAGVISAAAPDLEVAVDLDLRPWAPAGGQTRDRRITVGWHFDASDPVLTEARGRLVARTVFQHELAHVFGWEHAWGDRRYDDAVPPAPASFFVPTKAVTERPPSISSSASETGREPDSALRRK